MKNSHVMSCFLCYKNKPNITITIDGSYYKICDECITGVSPDAEDYEFSDEEEGCVD